MGLLKNSDSTELGPVEKSGMLIDPTLSVQPVIGGGLAIMCPDYLRECTVELFLMEGGIFCRGSAVESSLQVEYWPQ